MIMYFRGCGIVLMVAGSKKIIKKSKGKTEVSSNIYLYNSVAYILIWEMFAGGHVLIRPQHPFIIKKIIFY
jgi:hypothetical protein